MACHVALVGEPGLDGRLRQRHPALDRGACQVDAAPGPVPVGAGPEGPPEVAGQREPVGSGDLLQGGGRGLLPRVSGQVLACQFHGPDVDHSADMAGPAGEHAERVGSRDCDLDAMQVADRLIDVGQEVGHAPGGWAEGLDRVGDKRQRPGA